MTPPPASPPAWPPALQLDNLSVSYGATPILHCLSLTVAPGQCVGLVGESGCGKSTAALAALRALPRGGRITAGTIGIDGQDVTALSPAALRHLRATRVSMVYQDPSRALNPTLTIGAQLREAYAILAAPDAQASAEAMLARVQIPSPARIMAAYPHQLSGGMLQRVVIAMAVAKNPALLVLDEPTTGLDATVEAGILDLVQTLRRAQGTAILLISHNLPMVARMCDRIGVLYAGRLVEEGPAADILRTPRHPYTARLLACLPGATRRKQDGPLQTIPGQLPSPGLPSPRLPSPRLPSPHLPSPPCVFAPRCDRAEAICRTTPPPNRVTHGHMALCHFAPPFPPPAATAAPLLAPTARTTPALQARHLSKTYAGPGGTFRALDDVSFQIGIGQTLGVVGESGSGKTTLARLLLGLTAPDAGGTVTLDGIALSPTLAARTPQARQALQIIFQNPDSALNRAQRIRTILTRPLIRLAHLPRHTRAAALATLAAAVRLGPEHLAMRPRALSGGLKQRAAIARAFAGNPRVVICDEPTSALDVSVQAAILNLLVDLQARDATAYLFITHDLAVVRYLADRIAVMYRGQMLEIGPAEEVLAGPHHPYTAALVSASDHTSTHRLANGAPNTAGCIFQTACPRKIGTICETVKPAFDPDETHSIRCHIPWGELGR